MAIEALRLLLALTLVSSAVISLVLLIRRPMRRAFGASVTYRIWLLVPIPLVAMLLPGAPNASSEFVTYVQMDPVYSLVQRSLNVSLDTSTSINWYAWLLGAWGVGAAICLAWFLGAQRAYVRGLGVLAKDGDTLRAESSAGCPALLGVLRPQVVLPNDFEHRYTTSEQALVLAHENVHLERRDTLWNALAVLLRCVFWFNPLVHIAASFMREDQELACDATVIDRHPSSRRTYADAMLKTELADAALPVGCHWHSSQTFKERLEMLKMKLPSPARRALGGGLFAIASVIVAVAAWAAEPAPAPAAPTTADAPPAHHAMRKGFLKFPPDAQIQVSSSTANPGANGEMILEGDVVITVRPPAGPHRTVKVIKTPDGVTKQDVVKESSPHLLTVRAQKATFTRAKDGSATIQFDDGTIDTK
jgi:beta-lactamase regulating signal transducer with metallopeptidase domain